MEKSCIINSMFKYYGSRNFVSEQVYDAIWYRKPGTRIIVDITKDKCFVEEQVREEDTRSAQEG
jgi:hypothetical protein